MRPPWNRRSAAVLPLLGILLVATGEGAAEAQETVQADPARTHVTRAELEELLERLEAGDASDRERVERDRIAREVELVRSRLAEGDFQVGDRIVVLVEGEPELSDTLTVRTGRIVNVPVVGELSLHGVLRSELREHVEGFLDQYLREPTVRTEALIRISVHGEVLAPGFYVLAADELVEHALMIAGGPTAEAQLTDMRIERGSGRIWEGESMEDAIVQGRTFDQMNLRAGDRIVVPRESQRDGWEMTRVVAMAVGSLVSLGFALSRIF